MKAFTLNISFLLIASTLLGYYFLGGTERIDKTGALFGLACFFYGLTLGMDITKWYWNKEVYKDA